SRVPQGSQRAQRAAERGGRVPHRLRPRGAAPAGALVRRQSGATAPLAREGHVGAAGGPFRRGGLAGTARRLPRGRSERRGGAVLKRRGSGVRFVYLLAVYLAVPLVSTMLLWRGLRDRSYWHDFGERFGFGARLAPLGVWMHAVSVGEVQACAPLVSALARRHPRLPLTVTTFTPTGAARARALFGDIAQVRYLPYDTPGAVRRFFARVEPRLAVIFETELWPNLYRECGRRRVPLVLASARVSERSVGRYRRLGALFRAIRSASPRLPARSPAPACATRAARRFLPPRPIARCCCSTRSASSSISTPPRISLSSEEASRRSAATTCSSPQLSGFRFSPAPTTPTAKRSRNSSSRAEPRKWCGTPPGCALA